MAGSEAATAVMGEAVVLAEAAVLASPEIRWCVAVGDRWGLGHVSAALSVRWRCAVGDAVAVPVAVGDAVAVPLPWCCS